MGEGLYGDWEAGLSSTKDAHCLGKPTNLLEWLSKPVWTRCWKLLGAEISSFLDFFLENIFLGSKNRGLKNSQSKYLAQNSLQKKLVKQ